MSMSFLRSVNKNLEVDLLLLNVTCATNAGTENSPTNRRINKKKTVIQNEIIPASFLAVTSRCTLGY